MKRIYLQKVIQHDVTYYLGKADPREIVKIASKIEVGELQDAQRPLQEKKVKQIASYTETGILPNTLVLATNNEKMNVHSIKTKDDQGNNIELNYIEFPVTEKEYEKFQGSIEAMDGQHRLYSFDSKWRTIKNNEPYEIGFTLFITPQLSRQREIFLTCNEKQEKVNSNLIMYYKEKLKMLGGAEKEYYSLVNSLNNENISPIKGRIIMSAERIKNGIKAQQLIQILDKANINDSILDSAGNSLSDDKLILLISTYLKGWQLAIDFSFKNPDSKKDGAAYKTAGLRYMLSLLPTFWTKAKKDNKKFDEKFVIDTINQMLSNLTMSSDELFKSSLNNQHFMERSSTLLFAERCANIITTMDSGNFDPLA